MVFVLTIALSCFFSDARAGEVGLIESGVDAVERQLEMARHEKIIALKTNPQNPPDQFVSDGCSGGLSVGWEYLSREIGRFADFQESRPPWESCCVVHDRVYHTGGQMQPGAVDSFEARKQADNDLRECVVETGEKQARELMDEYHLSREKIDLLYQIIGDLMYRAVRVGGMPCTGLPWRWGYGWPECQ